LVKAYYILHVVTWRGRSEDCSEFTEYIVLRDADYGIVGFKLRPKYVGYFSGMA